MSEFTLLRIPAHVRHAETDLPRAAEARVSAVRVMFGIDAVIICNTQRHRTSRRPTNLVPRRRMPRENKNHSLSLRGHARGVCRSIEVSLFELTPFEFSCPTGSRPPRQLLLQARILATRHARKRTHLDIDVSPNDVVAGSALLAKVAPKTMSMHAGICRQDARSCVNPPGWRLYSVGYFAKSDKRRAL